MRHPERLGVCLDTCHLFAAGYDLASDEGYERVFGELGRLVGLERVRCFHLSDSKGERGSRLDRHAHIGRGRIASRSLGRLMRDARFARVPKIIETPKEGGMDGRNPDHRGGGAARAHALSQVRPRGAPG